jgi:hypothetical protein
MILNDSCIMVCFLSVINFMFLCSFISFSFSFLSVLYLSPFCHIYLEFEIHLHIHLWTTTLQNITDDFRET